MGGKGRRHFLPLSSRFPPFSSNTLLSNPPPPRPNVHQKYVFCASLAELSPFPGKTSTICPPPPPPACPLNSSIWQIVFPPSPAAGKFAALTYPSDVMRVPGIYARGHQRTPQHIVCEPPCHNTRWCRCTCTQPMPSAVSPAFCGGRTGRGGGAEKGGIKCTSRSSSPLDPGKKIVPTRPPVYSQMLSGSLCQQCPCVVSAHVVSV